MCSILLDILEKNAGRERNLQTALLKQPIAFQMDRDEAFRLWTQSDQSCVGHQFIVATYRLPLRSSALPIKAFHFWLSGPVGDPQRIIPFRYRDRERDEFFAECQRSPDIYDIYDEEQYKLLQESMNLWIEGLEERFLTRRFQDFLTLEMLRRN